MPNPVIHIWVIGRSGIYEMYCGKKFPKERGNFVHGFDFEKATCKTCIRCFESWEMVKEAPHA